MVGLVFVLASTQTPLLLLRNPAESPNTIRPRNK